jgi:hypothetical protein
MSYSGKINEGADFKTRGYMADHKSREAFRKMLCQEREEIMRRSAYFSE